MDDCSSSDMPNAPAEVYCSECGNAIYLPEFPEEDVICSICISKKNENPSSKRRKCSSCESNLVSNSECKLGVCKECRMAVLKEEVHEKFQQAKLEHMARFQKAMEAIQDSSEDDDSNDESYEPYLKKGKNEEARSRKKLPLSEARKAEESGKTGNKGKNANVLDGSQKLVPSAFFPAKEAEVCVASSSKANEVEASEVNNGVGEDETEGAKEGNRNKGRRNRLNFSKHYQGDERYYPGKDFDPKLHLCDGLDEQGKEVLRLQIEERKKSVESSLLSIFNHLSPVEVVVDGSGRSRYNYICPDCNQLIHNDLARHVTIPTDKPDDEANPVTDPDNNGAKKKKKKSRGKQIAVSKCKNRTREEAALLQSYYKHVFLYVTRLDKQGHRQPAQCQEHQLFYDNIYSHLEGQHGYEYGTADIEEMGLKLTKMTYQNVFEKCHSNKRIIEDKEDEETITEEVSDQASLNVSTMQTSDGEESDIAKKDGGEGTRKTIVRRVRKMNVPLAKETIAPCKKKLELTQKMKVRHKIENQRFTHYFNSSKELLDDFAEYQKRTTSVKGAKQHRSQLETLWKIVDKDMKIFPSKLSNPSLIETYYWNPLFQKLRANMEKPLHEQEPVAAPKTIAGYFSSVRKFIDYSINTQVYVGLTSDDFTAIEKKLQYLLKCQRAVTKDRKTKMDEWQADELITPNDSKNMGNSEHVQDVKEFLDNLDENTDPSLIKKWAVSVRNFLMVMFVLANAARASNIFNITLSHVRNAKTDKEFKGAMVLRSSKYKTSMLYGTKLLLISLDMFKYLQKYIKYCRPVLLANASKIDEKMNERFVFIKANNAGKMDHSDISDCLTSTFKKAKVFDNDVRDDRVSCTRIRSSICTELAGIGDEDLETLARSFMKHHPDTCKKFYVKAWSQRESARLSMKCISTFHLSNDAEVYKEMEVIRKEHEAKPVPNYKQAMEFVKKHFSEEDRNLLKIICNDLHHFSINDDFTVDEDDIDMDIVPVAAADKKTTDNPQRVSDTILRSLKKEEDSRSNRPRSCHVRSYADSENDDEGESALIPTVVIEPLPCPPVQMTGFSKEDWHKSLTYDRGIILSILFIAHDAIVSKDLTSISSNKWKELKFICHEREMKLHNMGEVDKIPWSKIKDIVNPMFEKYHRDRDQKDLTKFHLMYKDAIIAWRRYAAK